jgi:hypothetical protein
MSFGGSNLKIAKIIEAPTVTEPATSFERLHRDHAELTHSLADLNRAAARLKETAAGEAEVLAEISALGTAEIEAMTAWGRGGCIDDAPRPDQNKRIKLGQRLNECSLSATAARGAGADIDNQISGLNDLLRANAAEIEQISFDTMETEHGHIIAQYRANCEHGSKLAAKIHGLANFYGEKGRNLISHGDQDAGAKYLQRASALTNIKLPSPGVTRHEIEAAANDWSRRAATLRSGK